VVLLLVSAPANAAVETKTINFDDLMAPTRVTNQYEAQGVIFAGPTEYGFEIHGHEPGQNQVDQATACGPPFVRTPPEIYAPPTTHSPPNDAAIACGSEFYPGGTFMALTKFAKKVSAYVGDRAGDQFRLDAYDLEHRLIGHAEVTQGVGEPSINTPIELEVPSFEIAFVGLYRTNPAVSSSITAGVDDLSVTVGGAAPAIALSASIPAQQIAQGAHVEKTVTVVRLNGSEGNVELTAKGLPSGVTASFKPTILKGTESTSTLTLEVANNAPLSTTTGTLEAIPKIASAGTTTATLPVTLAIVPPFHVFVGGSSEVPSSTTVSAAPCSTTSVSVRTVIEQGFSGPVALTTSATVGSPDFTGATLEKSFLEPANFGISGENSQTMRITRGEGPVGGSFPVHVSGTGGPFTEPAATVNVERAPPTITSVSSSVGLTPRLGGQGTLLSLTGAGFCPGTTVAIGDEGKGMESIATPESISPDGTTLTFHVPRGAVTGPVQVRLPDGQRATGPAVTVMSFRNTNGFQWQNNDFGSRLNEEAVDEIFGKDETNIEVFQLFGWLVRKPEAYIFETVVNSNLEAGVCFGAAFTSLVLSTYPTEALRYPHTGAADAWHLDGPSGPSPLLLKELTKNFSLQFTASVIGTEINDITKIHTASEDLGEIQAGLAEHHPVIIGMSHFPKSGGFQGHAVLAYDTHPLPDGSTAVDIVNSNTPYNTEEESKPALHDANEFTKSQIIIRSNQWEFAQGSEISNSEGKPWVGEYNKIPATIGIGKLVVFKYGELPYVNGKKPKLPDVFDKILTFLFGSANDSVTQVTDRHGSLLSGGAIAPQGSWPKGVTPLTPFTSTPKPLQLVAANPNTTGPLTATVARSPGGGSMVMNLHGLQATLSGGARKGQVDTVTVDPKTDALGYKTNVSGATLTGSLVSAPGAAAGARATSVRASAAASSSSDHVVQLRMSAGRGRADQLTFAHGRELVVHHTGPAATVSLTLSALAANGMPVAVQLPAVTIGAGATLRVSPANWRALASTAVRVTTVAHGHAKTRLIHGHVLGKSFATVRRATLTALGGRRYRIDLTLAGHAPAHAWLSIAASVSSRGRVTERAKPVQILGAALAAGKVQLSLPKPLAAGRYKLALHLLEAVTSGAAQGARAITRTVTVVAH
jgi:hypothetical protein